MLTQSSPAIAAALSRELPPNVVQSLIQAIGNCNQPLTHRAPVNFQPPEPQQVGPGILGGNRWNWNDYADILPTSDQGANMDVAGWGGPGGWNSSNYYGDNFQFPTSQQFTLNNYYGGPNVHNGGNSYFQNSYVTNQTVENQYVTNLEVETINGEPVTGPAGPPGSRGDRGEAGRNGSAGLHGVNGRNGRDGRDAMQPLAKFGSWGSDLNITRETRQVVTDVSFDETSCTVVPVMEDVTFISSVTLIKAPLIYYGP